MKPATLKALKESVAHWRRLATGKARRGESIYGSDCPLCHLFNKRDKWCRGCPVKAATKFSHCHGSPWHAVSLLVTQARYEHKKWRPDRFFRTKIFRELATTELNFLKFLLPKKP